MREITLKNPIKVMGKSIKKLELDFEALTVADFINAQSIAHPAGEMSITVAVEMDANYQLALALLAITKAMPDLTEMDAKRIHGRDAVALMSAGRSFLLGVEALDGTEPPVEGSSPTLA